MTNIHLNKIIQQKEELPIQWKDELFLTETVKLKP